MTTARLSYNHRVIFTTSIYKSLDARTMTLQKSQGVGMPAVQLSCYDMHGFKLLSMFIFAFHLNCVSKSLVTNRVMRRLVFLIQGMEQRDTYVYILMSISKFCSFHQV